MTQPIQYQRGHIPIQLDGDEPRILIFDKRATFTLVQKFGINFMQKLLGLSSTAGEFTLRDLDVMEQFLIIGLQRDAEDSNRPLPEPALDGTSNLYTPIDISMIAERLMLALTKAQFVSPVELGKDAPAAAPVAAEKNVVQMPSQS
jgi:hypothetical protein